MNSVWSAVIFFQIDSPAKSVDFSGDKLALITTDPFMKLRSVIHVKQIEKARF